MMRATVRFVAISVLALVPFVDGKSAFAKAPRHPESGYPEVVDPMKFDFMNQAEQVSYIPFNQKPGFLSNNASADLASKEATSELICNACLVTVVEIAASLRKYWNDLSQRESRKLKKQEAIDVLHSTCNTDGVLSTYGLVVEAEQTKAAFSRETEREFLASGGFGLRSEPAIPEVLIAECHLLLEEYEGDFLVIIGRDHQNLELQSNLCGPEPGIAHCKTVTPDWKDRKEIYNQEERRKAKARREAAEAWAREVEESDDPLAYLYEKKDDL